ncbi:MAG: ComEA family DNA-binding protein, partial [Ilumatobacteraceae bacterium]
VRSAWCTVATITVETKAAYGLSVDPVERDAIAEMLDTCGESGQVSVPVGDATDVPVETVPTDTAAPDTTAPAAETTPTPDDDEQAAVDGCVDINTAGLDDLDRIVNIGPSRADQMLGLRPFSSVEDMIRISGIGEASLVEIIEQGLACVR